MLDPQAAPAAGVEARYRELTPASLAAFERAHPLVPGGAPGGLAGMRPYPVSITRGQACHVWDADGRRLVDMMQGDWLLPLGHGNPQVVEAITAQLAKGTTFAAPDPDLAHDFVRLLQSRMPSLERMRFSVSGTEAVMHALRIARVATGRPKVAKMRGGYHGTYDPSLIANYRWKDPDHIPPGLAPDTVENLVLLAFNDVERTAAALERHGRQVAAIIVEPVIGGSGMIPADREYLQALRELADQYGIVLVLDEMVTFTYGPHGAQGHYGITPDLTTLGKAIGGGLPLAAFGGKAELMDLCDGSLHGGVPPVRHAATFGGIPISLAAGIAAVRQLTPAVHAELHRLGGRVRAGITGLGRTYGIPLQATGAAHYFCIQWTHTPVVDFDTALTSDREIVGDIVLALNVEGFMLFFSNGVGLLSEPMDDEHVDAFLAALERSLAALGLIPAAH